MKELWQVIDNEFSVYAINILNLKLDEISSLVSENMEVRTYEKMEDELTDRLVEIFCTGIPTWCCRYEKWGCVKELSWGIHNHLAYGSFQAKLKWKNEDF